MIRRSIPIMKTILVVCLALALGSANFADARTATLAGPRSESNQTGSVGTQSLPSGDSIKNEGFGTNSSAPTDASTENSHHTLITVSANNKLGGC